jgi:hypothetical protein
LSKRGKRRKGASFRREIVSARGDIRTSKISSEFVLNNLELASRPSFEFILDRLIVLKVNFWIFLVCGDIVLIAFYLLIIVNKVVSRYFDRERVD